MSKKFWTIDSSGNEVLRDLEKEHETFSLEKYSRGEFDANNFIWYEMFDFYIHDAIGCDYERKGCFIKEGDVVVDLGANIGVFAHRAELRGASKVICFEPLSITYDVLKKNLGPKSQAFQLAVGGVDEFKKFGVHTDFKHLGGGFSLEKKDILRDKKVIHEELAFSIDINRIFDGSITDKIDFLKIDVEGGEVEILNSITDKNLNSLRCLAAEFHCTNDDFEKFQSKFQQRVYDMNFTYFTLYHGNGYDSKLRTITCWKNE